MTQDDFARFARAEGAATDFELHASEAEELAAVRKRLQVADYNNVVRPAARPFKIPRSVAIVATCVAAAAIYFLAVRVQPELLYVRYFNEPSIQREQPLALDELFLARADAEVSLTRGGTWRVRNGSGLRVLRADADQVDTYFDRGEILVADAGQQTNRMLMGPFVLVSDGAFKATWDPDVKSLVVEAHRGHLEIDGPKLHQHTLRNGDALWVHWSAPDRDWIVESTLPSAAPAAPAAATAETTSAALPTRGDVETHASEPPQAHAPRANTVRTTITRCAAEDWPRLSAGTDAVRVHAFALVCRDARNHVLASEALRWIRNHPADATLHAAATFELARLVARTHPLEARTLLQEYLRAPGTLQQEALGRLLEMSEGEEQMRNAESYLSLHPNGPYAGFAARILENAVPENERQ